MREQLIPRPAQQAMKRHAYENPYCALWADMGAGKTATCLDLAVDLLDWCDVSKILVVATKRVAKNTWPKEVKRWDRFEDLTCRVIEAEDFQSKRMKVPIKKRRKGRVVVEEVTRNVPQAPVEHFLTGEPIHTIHRDLLAQLVTHLGAKHWPYDLVILDESSGFRDQDSKRFKAANVLRKHGCIGRLIELSGTPSPKSLLGLWSQIYLLDQGERFEVEVEEFNPRTRKTEIKKKRTFTAFRDHFFNPGRQGKDANGRMVVFNWTLKPGAREEIFRRISDICLSVLPEDCGVELPERTFHNIEFELPEAAMKQYRDMERDYLVQHKAGDIVASNRGVQVFKLVQMAGGAVYDENGVALHIHDAALDAMEELVDSMQGKPLLVAYWYQHEKERILARFPEARELDENPETEDEWNRGEIPIMLIHPASGAHGLNLQFNDGHCLWFGPIHDLELYLQLNKRLHRPGRKYPVRIYHLIATGTIALAVLESLAPKNEEQDLLLEATRIGKGSLTPVIAGGPEPESEELDVLLEATRIRIEQLEMEGGL